VIDFSVTGYLSGEETVTTTITKTTSKAMVTQLINWGSVTKVEFQFGGGETAEFGALDNFVTN
jgi:sulfatase maturation enzyme AslB (radical SAM superfamily)